MRKLECRREALFQYRGLPPVGMAVSMALQHLVAMIVGCVTPAIIIANVAGLAHDQRVLLIQASLVMSAVTTLLQLFPIGGRFGAGLPVIFGVSFAYLPSMQAIVSGSGGLAAVSGAMIVGGAVAALVGIFIKPIRRLFPPVITGTVVFTIGLSLYPTAKGDKQHAVLCLELSGAPVTFVYFDTEVLPEQRIELQFALQIGQKAVRAVFRFADQYHYMDSPCFLDHEPNRNHQADMRAFGVPSCPLEHGAGMAVRFQIFSSVYLEFSAAGYLFRFRIGAQMGKVGFHEIRVIFPRPADTRFFGLGGIGQPEIGGEDQLLPIFPLFPFVLA